MKDRALKLLRFLIDRLREPSTFAGFGAVAAMLHHQIPDATLAGLIAIGGVVAGIAAILLPEKK
jgi:hypothetical protein